MNPSLEELQKENMFLKCCCDIYEYQIEKLKEELKEENFISQQFREAYHKYLMEYVKIKAKEMKI